MNDPLFITLALLSLIIFVVCPILYFGLKLFLEIVGLVIILVLLFAYGMAAVGFVLLVCLIALPFVLIYRYFFDGD